MRTIQQILFLCSLLCFFALGCQQSRNSGQGLLTGGNNTSPSRGLAALTSGSVPWSNILAPSRAIDWSKAGLPATLPDGETTANPWTPPTRTQYGSTILPSGNAATDLNNINTALSQCPDGHYILLGSGTFLIQGTIVMYQHSCTLRGSGGQSTTLNMNGSGIIFMGAASGGGSCALTSGSNYTAGSTSITCTGLSGAAPTVGVVATLTQCDTGYTGTISGGSLNCSGAAADNGGLYVCGDNNACQIGSSATAAANHQYQTLTVTSVTTSGSTYTLGISQSLYMPNWSYAQTPLLSWNDPRYNGVGVGLEDMTVSYTGTSVGQVSVQMQNTYASWIKGVRFLSTASNNPVSLSSSVNDLIANNYAFTDTAIDGNYEAIVQMSSTSATLLVNNIETGNGPLEGMGGNSGNVYAFNLGRDVFTLWPSNEVNDHHAYSSFELFEGNQMGVLMEDDTWGTHDLNSYFRNYAPCSDAPYTTYSNNNYRSVQLDNYHRFINVVGNALGGSQCGTYSGSGSGSIYQFTGSDSLVTSTVMRWGNVSAVTQSTDTPANSGVRFVSSEVPSSLASPNNSLSNPVPSTSALPGSFFMNNMGSYPNGGTGLSWWKVCTNWTSFPTSCGSTQTQPFPIAGPDVSGGPYVNGYSYDIPASIAWRNLPVDPAYQKSYTITGSSWANGTETLTVTGLPNVTHLMGAFQLSGVNSACTTGATINASSEILITGSSSTTISYALPSNPGVNCTGTFKFPDVRMFDERVYQQDGSATSPAPTPTPAPVTSGATPTPTPVPVTATPTPTPVPAPVSSGASALVQSNSNAANSNAASVSFNTTNNAGDLILVQAVWVGTSSVSSVTDSLGNTYQAATSMQVSPGGNSQQIFYAKNIAGGSNTVTVTTASSSLVILFAQEFSGIDAVNPIDVTASATGSGTAVSSGGATTHYSNEILFGGIESDGNIQSAGSGYASLAVLYGNLAEYASGSSAGSFAATGTNDSSGWIAQLVALKPAGTTSTTPAPTPTPAPVLAPTPVPVTATPTPTSAVAPTPTPTVSTDVVKVTQTPSGNVTLSSSYLTIKASASSNLGRTITGWHIYVDGVNVYSAGQTSSISTTLKFSPGTHKVVTRAWDSAGTYGSYSITVKR